MERRDIPSSEIYPFLIEPEKVDKERVRSMIGDYDPKIVPPVPVFEIPEPFRANGWKYVLPDGNTRWLFAHATSGVVSAALFAADERMSAEANGLAPFRHIGDPNLYRKTLGIYLLQEGISGRVDVALAETALSENNE